MKKDDYYHAGLPEWVRALRPRGLHIMSWCPYCHLGWPRDENAVRNGACCSIATPMGYFDLHVPSAFPAQESETALIQYMLLPPMWMASRLLAAGMMGRKKIPSLTAWMEASACAKCRALRKFLGRPYARCVDHDPTIGAESALAFAESGDGDS